MGYKDGRRVVLSGYRGHLNTVSVMGCSKAKQVCWPLGWGRYCGCGLNPAEGECWADTARRSSLSFHGELDGVSETAGSG